MRAFVRAVGTEDAFSAGGMEAEFAVSIRAAAALVRMSGWGGEVGEGPEDALWLQSLGMHDMF